MFCINTHSFFLFFFLLYSFCRTQQCGVTLKNVHSKKMDNRGQWTKVQSKVWSVLFQNDSFSCNRSNTESGCRHNYLIQSFCQIISFLLASFGLNRFNWTNLLYFSFLLWNVMPQMHTCYTNIKLWYHWWKRMKSTQMPGSNHHSNHAWRFLTLCLLYCKRKTWGERKRSEMFKCRSRLRFLKFPSVISSLFCPLPTFFSL